jgi:uncharacterized protein YbjT (DUF2867 family)
LKSLQKQVWEPTIKKGWNALSWIWVEQAPEFRCLPFSHKFKLLLEKGNFMEDKKIIAIMGATGAQGSGLVQAILNDGEGTFVPRAITRNTDSDKARALREQGVEVVAADMDDVASLERAFEGAYGVFSITNFWETFSPDKEMVQAKNQVDAAKSAGVRHIIWSSLEDTRNWMSLDDNRMPTLMEKYKVPHFDGKGEANKYFEESGVPYTILNTSFYWDNFIHFGMGPQKGPDGNYGITFPMGEAKLPGIAAKDIGKCAYGIFKAGGEYQGREVGISGEQLTGKEMAEMMGKALNMKIGYNDVPPEVYRNFPFDGADDMGNMFQFKRDFNEDFCNMRDVEFTRSLNPELQDLNAWLEENKKRIPLN